MRGDRPLGLGHLLDERLEREGDDVRLDHARFDLRDVEQAVEHLLEVGDRELDAVHHALRARIGEALLQHRGVHRQRLHRLAQVVARRGEELGLGDVRRLGFAARLLQALARRLQPRDQHRHVSRHGEQHQHEGRAQDRMLLPERRQQNDEEESRERQGLREMQVPAPIAEAVADRDPEINPVEHGAGFRAEHHACRGGAHVEEHGRAAADMVGPGAQEHPAEVRDSEHKDARDDREDQELAVIEHPVEQIRDEEVQLGGGDDGEAQLRLRSTSSRPMGKPNPASYQGCAQRSGKPHGTILQYRRRP